MPGGSWKKLQPRRSSRSLPPSARVHFCPRYCAKYNKTTAIVTIARPIAREMDMIRRTATRRARFDESSFRADTPGASNVVHLNAAGAGLPPRLVTDTVVSHLEREASVGPHWAAAEAGPRLEGVRTSVA